MRIDMAKKCIHKNNELKKQTIDDLKVLYNNLNPKRIIRQKVIDNINKKAHDLVNGKTIAIDLDLSKFNSTAVSETINEFRDAGFKVGLWNKGNKKYIKIKL